MVAVLLVQIGIRVVGVDILEIGRVCLVAEVESVVVVLMAVVVVALA